MDGPRAPRRSGEDPKKSEQELRRRQSGFMLSYVLVALLAMWLFQQLVLSPAMLRQIEIPYSEFKTRLKAGQVADVTLGTEQITGTIVHASDVPDSAQGAPFVTTSVPDGDPTLIEELDAAGVTYSVSPPPNPIGSLLLSYVLPLALVGIVWYFMYRRIGAGARGGGGIMGGIMGVGKSKATEVQPEQVGVTFKDVGGADEAIEELREIIDFLKTPERFVGLGARIPKGVLLVGPPGTGKTLLAKATAGEAGVPFFETSGSEFVEMFVGVGAARVRDLFDQARKVAPAIIFIDEIDAIGQSRAGASRFGGNDEREQTLNQLLSEIDGFTTETGKPVIIMAATNRPEILDQALLRAGRFDRQVTVSAPDLAGRLQILKIHSKDVKLAEDFDLERAARITPGFTGADLANVMNEAALLAAREGAPAVNMAQFESSIERVVAGLEKKSLILNEKERAAVATHESGHALIAALVPHADPVAKVSIVPRSRGALGYTMQMPTEDRYLMTSEELTDRLAVMLGGRAAEIVVYNVASTGASDDIKRATDMARRMVTEFGMSEKLGVVRYSGQQLQFLEGGDVAASASPDTLRTIDQEVQRIIDEQYQRARQLLTEHRSALDRLAKQLLEVETVDGEAVRAALDATA